jgi:PAS domain S-box-containing protein
MSSEQPDPTYFRDSAAALRGVLIYAGFSALWILLSDRVARFVARDAEQFSLLSTVKGWVFVGVTSLLLYRLMRRQLAAGKAPERRARPFRRDISPLLILALAILGLTWAGIHQAYRQQEVREDARLQAIASFKARQISDWLEGHLGDARFTASSTTWSVAFDAWVKDGNAGEREHLLGRLEEFRKMKGFSSAVVIDLATSLVVGTGPGAPHIPALLRKAVEAAAADRKVRVVGPYKDSDGSLHIEFLAPLGPDPQGPVVVFAAEPGTYFLPLLRTWPVPSATGETLLFRKEGEAIQYLNAGDGALSSGNLGAKGSIAAAFLRGEGGQGTFIKGADYRGIPSAGVVQPVPGTDWYVLAKVDQAEISSSASAQVAIIALASLLGLFLSVLVNHLFRQQRSLMQAERDRTLQAERLRALQLLDGIANGSSDAIYARNRAGRFVLYNPEAERVFGKHAVHFREDDTRDAAAEDDETVLREDPRILERGETVQMEEVLPTTFGPRTFLVTKGPLRSAEGEIIGLYGIAKDITDRINAEHEREALQSEIQQAQKLESIGRLAGGVAHDFNNMLGVIVANAEIGILGGGAQGSLERFEEIKKAALRSADLTRQLLAFARKQTVSPKVISLNEAIPGMLQMLARLIGENITLDYAQRDGLWNIRIDPVQVDQILANLAVNARDAISGVGSMTIRTANLELNEADCAGARHRRPGRFVLLEVGDTGCGMDAERLKHIFEPFFTTKGVGKGTGLGLATVYGIVKQNNGFIEVSSEIGKGTLIQVHLPSCSGDVDQPAAAASASPDLGTQEKILVVEDERMNLEVTVMLLETLGYEVLSTSSPGEALRMLAAAGPELRLLLTDIIMPEMNGRELAERARAEHPGLKCLFMSGYTDDIMAQHGVLSGEVKLLEKPFTLEALAARVREMLD